jgi:hypothetical protein
LTLKGAGDRIAPTEWGFKSYFLCRID